MTKDKQTKLFQNSKPHTSNNKLIIGVDVDGTLTDLNDFYINTAASLIKKEPINPSAYSFEDIFEFNKKGQLLYGLRILQHYCKNCPIREKATNVLCDLRNQNYELHIISARKFVTNTNLIGVYYRKLLQKWFKKNNLSFDSIVYCSEQFAARDKLLGCRKLHVDLMIDDKPDVSLYLAENGIKVLLIDAPYNQGVTHKNITRVYDWPEIQTYIKSYIPINIDTTNLSQEYQKLKNCSKVLDVKKLNRGKTIFKLLYMIMYPFVRTKFNPIVISKEKLPYQDGYLLCSNHLYSCDNYLINYAAGRKRFFAGLAASEIKNTFRGKLFNITSGGYFVDRKNTDSRKQASQILASRIILGDNALIFPEGTRKNKNADGKAKPILDFNKGAVSIAQKTGTGIIPVALHYGKRNKVMFGDIFYVLPNDDIVKKTDELQSTILNMSIELSEKS